MNSMMNLVAIIYAIPFIEKQGRRTMLMFGEVAIIVAQFGLFASSLAYNVDCHNYGHSEEVCSVLATVFQSFVTILIFSFEISAGPLYYVVVGEYFPEQFRIFLGSVSLF